MTSDSLFASSSSPLPSAQELQQRLGKLADVQRILKEEFIGIDAQIDEIINAIRPWYLLPQTMQRPIVVGLWGRTGVGKTSVVVRLVELLGLEEQFGREDLGKFTSDSRYNGGDDLGIFEKFVRLSGRPSVFLLDEMHTARTRHATGGELDRPNIRDVWIFLDTGKIPRDLKNTESLMVSFIERVRGLRLAVETPSEPPFKPSPQDLTIWEIDQFRRTIGIPGHAADLQIEWGKDPIRFYDQAIEKLRAYMSTQALVDFSQSLVFVAGNIDEAFLGSGSADPNAVVADDLYDSTLKITVNDLKSALLTCFRPEQVARLGRTHILFPGFSSHHYEQLVALKLKQVSQRIHAQLALSLEFDASVHRLLLDESMIPTQGARPVISLIGEFIESQIPVWCTQIRLAGLSQASLRVRYDARRKMLLAETKTPTGTSLPVFESCPATLQTRIRDKQFDPVVQQIIAVHEAGHAVVGIVLLGMLPKMIRATTLHGMGGHVEFGEWPIVNAEMQLSRVSMALGGRAAEKIVFGDKNPTSGSYLDLREATSAVSQMVTQYGMGPHLGQSHVDMSLPDSLASFKPKDDAEKERLLKIAYADAQRAIQSQNSLFRVLIERLGKDASLGGSDLQAVILKHYQGSDKEKQSILNRKQPKAYEAYQRALNDYQEAAISTPKSRGKSGR